jgi:hypothetical protein
MTTSGSATQISRLRGGALLGFAGLMLAANLVFLSADKQSLIGSDKSWGTVGFAALIFPMAGAFCSLLSIMISRKGSYLTARSSLGLMKLYHDRRRRWLSAVLGLHRPELSSIWDQ